jgi:VCBS repeat-containing protein
VAIPPPPEPIRGTAIEDGPLVRLVARPDNARPTESAAPPIVQVPASLPAGVKFDEDSQNFALNPSHPAYQHLGQGESATVTVHYTLLINDTPVQTSVSWTVTGRNDDPAAGGDRIAVREVGTRVLAVRANDRDVDGDALEIVSWTAPLAGSVSRNSDGNLVFDPGEDFRHLGAGETAQVSFSYTVSDGQGGTDTTSVTLQVVGRNDAPVAVRDRIAVNEVGEQVLALRANDRDVDGDVLQILDWTPPLEGSAFLNSAGDLVFDPGEDFRALGAGETATVSFFYTVSDGQGGTDTASVTLEVIGSGTFSSPPKTASTSGILGFNQQAVSLSIEAPSATTSATADLDLSIGLGPVVQPQMNIVYVVDISGSTSDPFEGTPVGDLNGDGRSNTVLDAEIASLITLTDQVTTLGFSPGDVTITVIPFNSSADPATGSNSGAGPLAAATFSLGGAGEELIADYLRDLDAIASGSTNFTDALRAANDRLQRLDQGNENNFLYFLSDGRGEGPVEAELARLNEVFDTKIAAVGVGANADLDLLNIIDNTDGASLLTAPNQIEVSVLGAPIPSGTITDLDLFVNGAEVIEIGPEDLVSTSDGFALDASLAGLQRLIGRENTVSASVTFASGEILTTQLTIAGALPLSTDLAV